MPQFIASVVTILVVANLALAAMAYCILLERKVAAWVQDRIGPNRAGFNLGQAWLPKFHFWGLGQPLADGIKMIFKEDYTPPYVEKPLFYLAPVLAFAPALLGWVVVPWGGWLEAGATIPFTGIVLSNQPLMVAGANLDLGVIYILAIGSVAVYGAVVAGYASNSKYSFLGSLRATAQMVSYEIPLGLTVLIILLMAGTANPDKIISLQVADGMWNLVYMPLLAVIFLTCSLAECNRTPFDLAEAEQELVGGYHTEYTSMRLGVLLMSEYMHLITAGAFFSLMFLGGWSISPLGLWPDLPLAGGLGLVALKMAVFAGKVAGMIFLIMLIRWTVPRFRFDQLMRLAWTGLIPMTLVLLVLAGVIQFAVVTGLGGLTHRGAMWALLGANVLVLAGAMLIGPLMPAGPPVNRRIPLAGSRFNAPPAQD